MTLRSDVLKIYKELLFLGRDYPKGYRWFRTRLQRAFRANAGLSDDAAVRAAIQRAEFVRRELEALYYLRKYRALKQRYGGS